MLYAKVIVPRPLDEAFTYIVPEKFENSVAKGKRVVVPFGPKRHLTGIVESVVNVRPTDVVAVKEIEDVLDSDTPTVINPQIKFWHWLADYYMCPIGDVMKAALPSALKLESESIVTAVADIDPQQIEALTDDEFKLFDIIASKEKLSIKELTKLSDIKNAEAIVSRMVDKAVVTVHETMVNRYRRIKVQQVVPTIPEGDAQALTRAFDAVKRSRGQQQALLKIISLSGFNNATKPTQPVSKTDILDDEPAITWENVVALKKKGLVEINTHEVSRFDAPDIGNCPSQLPQLSEAQSTALNQIHKQFLDKNVTLLHGVTSSGKTEIYTHLIDHVLRQGRQVLFLVPEIALTTQLTHRLQKVFGSKVRIYHSRFTDSERVDIWRKMLTNPEPCIVIGARSTVFLPFTNLGLVIVDEEHESSYKQFDPAPRYNGRDAAIVLASMHGAKTLLGSATPSIETYYKASDEHKYGFVELTTRYGDVALPSIQIIDMDREHKKKAVDGAFSHLLIKKSNEAIDSGRQLIYFHNRRGFSPRARCRQCQFVPKCDHCDVTLTYHRKTSTLECHYCGAVYPLPKVCPACHEPTVTIEGYGTERLEDGLEKVFPGSTVLRMDLDTTRNKDAYSKIIDQFSDRKADILVGTQMVTKGLDFANVGLVAVVNADNVLHHPDFRSSERAFNMLEQVSGRAGRSAQALGHVMIQTYSPEHKVIQYVKAHNYKGFFEYELAERQKYCYPPFSRIINVYLKHRNRETVEKEAARYADALRGLLGNRVNGPIEPVVERIASLYIRQVMLKIETTASIARVKDVLRQVYIQMQSSPERSEVIYQYDVDPA